MCKKWCENETFLKIVQILLFLLDKGHMVRVLKKNNVTAYQVLYIQELSKIIEKPH